MRWLLAAVLLVGCVGGRSNQGDDDDDDAVEQPTDVDLVNEWLQSCSASAIEPHETIGTACADMDCNCDLSGSSRSCDGNPAPCGLCCD